MTSVAGRSTRRWSVVGIGVGIGLVTLTAVAGSAPTFTREFEAVVAAAASVLLIGVGIGLSHADSTVPATPRTRSALEEAADGIAILTADGEYLEVNRAYADLHGYDDRSAFVGESWRLGYPPEALDRIEDEVLPAVRETGVWRGELAARHRDGHTFTQAASFALTDAADVVCVARDVPQQTDHEEQLARQADQMEFFNSILRHDVLNGMTVIRSRAEALAAETDGEQADRAETIVTWCDEIVEIVRRVRDVLDTRTADDEHVLEPVDLSGLLEAEVDRMRSAFPAVEFETDMPPGVTVEADDRLSEVLGTVVANAVEHNDREDLRVAVSVETVEGIALVRVADDGRGVPDDRKGAIFRRDGTGHAKVTGSGFGLFFVDAMVAKYGGEVWVEDNDAGGATFVIELARTGERQEQP